MNYSYATMALAARSDLTDAEQELENALADYDAWMQER